MDLWSFKEPKLGDIIRVEINKTYYHYGIYVSDDEVIQYGRSDDMLKKEKQDIEVLVTSIDEFRNKQFIEVRSYSIKERLLKNKPQHVVDLARARIGEKNYDIVKNNCEHFVNDCVFKK